MVTGSKSNVHPSLYGGEASEANGPYDPARDATTLPLIRKAIERGVPLLAICRGIQELNVALGGTLATEIQEREGSLDHRAPVSDDQDQRFAIHQTISIKPGSCLAGVFGAGDDQGQFRASPGDRPARRAPSGRGGRRRTARSRRFRCRMRRSLCRRRAVASGILGQVGQRLGQDFPRLRRCRARAMRRNGRACAPPPNSRAGIRVRAAGIERQRGAMLSAIVATPSASAKVRIGSPPSQRIRRAVATAVQYRDGLTMRVRIAIRRVTRGDRAVAS